MKRKSDVLKLMSCYLTYESTKEIFFLRSLPLKQFHEDLYCALCNQYLLYRPWLWRIARNLPVIVWMDREKIATKKKPHLGTNLSLNLVLHSVLLSIQRQTKNIRIQICKNINYPIIWSNNQQSHNLPRR